MKAMGITAMSGSGVDEPGRVVVPDAGEAIRPNMVSVRGRAGAPYAAGARLDRGSLSTHTRLEVMPFSFVEPQLESVPAGTTITVTCSPKHGIDHTLDFSDRLQQRGLEVVPHLAASMVRDHAHMTQVATRLRSGGYREVFVIGGDHTPPLGPYATAERLLSELAPRIEGVRIGIAGYPEGHPTIAADQLTQALLDKQDFASVLVTQICFDAQAIVDWIRSIRAAGIRLPVLIGVPGVVDRRRLVTLSTRVGVGASTRYLRKNLRLLTTLLRRATYRPDTLIDQLERATANDSLGVVGLHLFTFNEVIATFNAVIAASV